MKPVADKRTIVPRGRLVSDLALQALGLWLASTASGRRGAVSVPAVRSSVPRRGVGIDASSDGSSGGKGPGGPNDGGSTSTGSADSASDGATSADSGPEAKDSGGASSDGSSSSVGSSEGSSMEAGDGGSETGSPSAGCGCSVLGEDGQARTIGLGTVGLLGLVLRRRRRQR